MQATRIEDLPDVLTVQQVAEVLQCSDKQALVEFLNGGMAS